MKIAALVALVCCWAISTFVNPPDNLTMAAYWIGIAGCVLLATSALIDNWLAKRLIVLLVAVAAVSALTLPAGSILRAGIVYACFFAIMYCGASLVMPYARSWLNTFRE